MKKILFLFLIGVTTLLISCKKDKGCWKCATAGTYSGINYDGKFQTVCNDSDTPPSIVVDANGTNILSSQGCTR